MHTNIPVFCTYFEKDSPKYSISLATEIFHYYSRLHAAVCIFTFTPLQRKAFCSAEFPSFAPAPLQICGQVAPIVCPSLQFHSNILHNNILQSILFVAMHEKRATVNATTDRTEILDVGASEECWERVAPERVAVMERMERQLSGVPQVFMKSVCDDGENRAPPG